MRFPVMMMVCAVAVTVVGVSVCLHPTPRLIWNASASVPIGFYLVRPIGALRVDDLVVVTPPEPLADVLSDRGYLPKGVPLLKRIAALPGQTVCRLDRTITVDRNAAGEALIRDQRGRALPVWQGCRTVRTGEVFLMNRLRGDSLDGRYFGPLPTTAIIGQAKPLWTEKDH